MDRHFPPSWLAPDWVRPDPPKEPPAFLRHAAYFSLYAPFVLIFIAAIAAYGTFSSPLWRHYAMVIYVIAFRVTIPVAFALGVIGFLGGLKRRCVAIYVCAFLGCFFNGSFLMLWLLGIVGG